jgi:iron complex outermembrane receptor protein
VRGLYVTDDRNFSFLGARGFATPGDYNSRILLL